MRRIKIPQYKSALKMQGGAYVRGGAYLQDTTVCVSNMEDVTYFECITKYH